MQCHKCLATSRVIGASKGQKLRECENHHRWLTSTVEIRDTAETQPATAETVWALHRRGWSIRKIAKELLMSTTTVQAHLKAAPTLEGVWR